jgi:hypothetical protein
MVVISNKSSISNKWNGCYFHFGQAINRKIQEIGLINEYKDSANPW